MEAFLLGTIKVVGGLLAVLLLLQVVIRLIAGKRMTVAELREEVATRVREKTKLELLHGDLQRELRAQKARLEELQGTAENPDALVNQAARVDELEVRERQITGNIRDLNNEIEVLRMLIAERAMERSQ